MKISLITVSLNRANTIAHTMQSVLDQTYRNIEYIIVDGGSTDGTLDIIEEMKPKFKGRLTYISEPDSGVYNAINKGIYMATGNIIGILHADDYFSSNTILESVANGFKDKWVSLIYGDLHFIDPKNDNKTVRVYSSKLFTPDKLQDGFAPPHPTMYCRTHLYKRFGVYKENYTVGADFEMFVRLLKNPNVLTKYLPLDMVTMRIGGLSTQWKHRLTTNIIEKKRALKENCYKVSYLSLLRRYYYLFK